jgi:glycosyltransferase involved in cell wall biosynthesis
MFCRYLICLRVLRLHCIALGGKESFDEVSSSMSRIDYDVTVCILYRNSSEHLFKCLSALSAQAMMPSEVIVVGDAPVDGTLSSAVGFAGVKLIEHSRHRGCASALNSGLQASNNEIVAFLDDVCEPEPQWLSHLVAPLEEGKAAICTGWSTMTNQWKVPSPWLLNFACRKSLLEAAGWFDVALSEGPAYLDLQHRLKLAGHKALSADQAVAVHQVPTSSLDLFRRYTELRLPQLALGQPFQFLLRTLPSLLGRPGRRLLQQISWFLYVCYSPTAGRSPAVSFLERDLWPRPPGSMNVPVRLKAWWFSAAAHAYAGIKSIELRLVWAILKTRDIFRRRQLISQFPVSELRSSQQSSPYFARHVSISACIMTMNQELILPLPLSSVKGWVDEILVIDGGSTDRTVEVAEAYGARVIRHLWPGRNSLQRNVYLEHAKGDWLLALDSDEFLDETAPQVIPELVRNRRLSHYWLVRKWLVLSRGVLAYPKGQHMFPDYQMRLFKNRRGIYYSGAIHEQLHGFGWIRNFVPDLSLYHADLIANSREDRVRKIERYEAAEPGSGYRDMYLFEDYDDSLQPIAIRSLPQAFQNWLLETYGSMFGPAVSQAARV